MIIVICKLKIQLLEFNYSGKPGELGKSEEKKAAKTENCVLQAVRVRLHKPKLQVRQDAQNLPNLKRLTVACESHARLEIEIQFRISNLTGKLDSAIGVCFSLEKDPRLKLFR